MLRERDKPMRDQMQELFRVALGLAEPWIVSRIEFSAAQHQLDLWVDFPSGSRFACPECGRAGCGAYDSTERTEQDLMELSPRESWTWLAHALIAHGRQVCTARQPKCAAYPLAAECPSAVTAPMT